MRVVRHRIEALRAAMRQIALVSVDRELVAADRVGVAADALVDVRGHVDHVPRRRHQGQDRVRRALGSFRRRGRFEQVNQQVQRGRVGRIAAQHVLGERDDVGRAGVRTSVRHPVVPRPQVHHRLDVEHRDVEVAREAAVHRAHGLGVGAIVGGAVGGPAAVAPGQRRRSAPARAARRAGPEPGPAGRTPARPLRQPVPSPR